MLKCDCIAAGLCYSAYLGYLFSTSSAAPLFHCTGTVTLCIATLISLDIVTQGNGYQKTNSCLQLRKHCSLGAYLVPLLPLCIIPTVASDHNWTDDKYLQLKMAASILILLSSTISISVQTLPLFLCAKDNTNFKNHQAHSSHLKLKISIMGLAVLLGLAGVFVLNKISDYHLGTQEMLAGCVLCASMAALQLSVPWLLPNSFSLGENAVCCQGVMYFLFVSSCQLFDKFEWIALPSQAMSTLPDSQIFMQVAVLSAMLVVVILVLLPDTRSSIMFYLLVFAVAATVSMPLLYVCLRQNFIVWILTFVTRSPSTIYIFIYWAFCSLIGVFLVYRQHSISEQRKAKDSNQTKKTGSTTIDRKQFHALAVMVLLPGLMYHVEMLCTAMTCLLVVFIMLECMRILKVWPVGEVLQQAFSILTDAKDEGPVILTHLYLMVGCIMPLWLWKDWRDQNVVLSCGLLSLGIGDTMASVVGYKLGSLKWPGTSKTVEGTLAGLVTQFLVIFILQVSGVCKITSITTILIAVLLTSILEAFTTQIDNLILPLYMYIILIS